MAQRDCSLKKCTKNVSLNPNMLMLQKCFVVFLAICCCANINKIDCDHTADENTSLRDVRENDKVVLECRFPVEDLSRETPTFYWSRSIRQKHDNAAIGDDPLDPNYKLDYRPESGVYDLVINGTSYDRDNGRFECHVKARGSGIDLYAKTYILTVLTIPQPPQIAPASFVIATEGRRQDLTCSSMGGSPDPTIEWFREGSNVPLEASVKLGESKDKPTTSTLTLIPNKVDDGAVYRCVVRNRAMPKSDILQVTVTLSVNYYPRIEVGPENPLRVERDSSAVLECSADAKPSVNSVKWTRNGRIISSTQNYILHRVSVQDAGKYVCSGDNNLGKTGEHELDLDVLFGPIISLSAKTQEAYEGESVTIKCNISSNPSPVSVEWIKDDGRHDFKQIGEVLRLEKVTADNSGTYTCRAKNILNPSVISNQSTNVIERTGNGSIALLIRHKPGRARILPDRPIVNEGASVTLTCMATPSGWPSPQFRWFKIGHSDKQQNVIETGTKYYISSVQLSHEGSYYCQATNELGHGEAASVHLQVNQPPRFLSKLNAFHTKKVSNTYDYAISCKVQAKPRAEIEWLKDGEELLADINMYEVKMNYTEDRFGVVTVLSILRFNGRARPKGNQLLPSDRGVYTCVAHNEVRKIESTMQLRVEHEPISLNQYNKVAYDFYENGEIPCKIQAYPRPDFHWYFQSSLTPLQSNIDGHYLINSSTTLDNDIYTSVLNVRNINQADYGEYICQVNNDIGSIMVKIRLEAKGPPDQPTTLIQRHIGHNNVTLSWMAGFNGGVSTTKYFVLYRKVSYANMYQNEVIDVVNTDIDSDTDNNDNSDSAQAMAKQRIIDGCGHNFYSSTYLPSEQFEFDCQQKTVCTILNLDQDQTYEFKVKAINSKGSSDYSPIITLTTDVDKIPNAQRVAFNPNTKILSMSIPATCLKLDAIVEVQVFSNNIPYWQITDNFALNQESGNDIIYREHVLEHIPPISSSNDYLYGSRAMTASISASHLDNADVLNSIHNDVDDESFSTRIRVQLCLNANRQQCGDYADAEIGSIPIRETTSLAASTLIAIIVSCIVFILFIIIFLSFCNCNRIPKQKDITHIINKDYEMDAVRIAQQQQQQQSSVQLPPPPPYYPDPKTHMNGGGPISNGMDNKGLEHCLDVALSTSSSSSMLLDEKKNHAIYATNNHYGYHKQQQQAQPSQTTTPSQQNLNNEWMNVTYLDNSSIHSKDILWQIKNAQNQQQQQYLIDLLESQNSNYSHSYDPINHGGYSTLDDYATYPQLGSGVLPTANTAVSISAATTTAAPSPNHYSDQQQSYLYNQIANDYNRRPTISSNNDSYASVIKPKKKLDHIQQQQQSLDCNYHDINGLTNAFDHQQQSKSSLNSYDDGRESTYSTPNSRSRRIIREIIV